MPLSITDLISTHTADEHLEELLTLADALGLETETWQEGDPSRTILAILAHRFAVLEAIISPAAAGGLLEYATGSWLTLLARNLYGAPRIEEQYASGEVTLTNAAGVPYAIAAGDLTMQASATGATYRNTTGGVLIAGGTLDVDVLAEQAGSTGSAGVGGVDTMVSTLLGVTVSNAAAIIGQDDESDDALRARCLLSLAAVSPSGAADAYDYVARSTLRTDGTTVDVTRTRVWGDTATGTVYVRLAGSNGAPVGSDVTLVTAALTEQVLPVACLLNCAGATNVSVAVTSTVYVPTAWPESDPEIQALVLAALGDLFTSYAIGGQTINGTDYYLFLSHVQQAIHGASEGIYASTVALPAANVALTSSQVAQLGAVTTTVTRL